MTIFPFIVAVIILVVFAFVGTFLIGLKPVEAKQRSFKQRSRNLLLIYGCITSMLVIALAVFLYNL
ncbi:hypothetical protein BAG01nite_12090 [Brevibacillus agri]|uniref:Uncharacterized protein n=1 Tax=Brevibacillus agri TaxID=51101 RepID=A0A3M8AK57_9BACL|nr:MULTISPECIES: hypothetical protein [Brevibacillus]ELK41529.1 hypothetical protein D478_13583 [Brevibacillus agri BAB-2500]EJL45216.1 hypothetical protein PMI08_01870 [Brevibacillus sp. CF112]MBG9565570.1 hypothetical protein [Brevibacillus agri]MBY0054671.1 hypothetical protein [Brevibacillus agri]MCG5252259.1 hypothetical protein [Brevibacillus agri]